MLLVLPAALYNKLGLNPHYLFVSFDKQDCNNSSLLKIHQNSDVNQPVEQCVNLLCQLTEITVRQPTDEGRK